MNPLYPLQGNPFVGIASMHVAYMAVYGFCSVYSIFGIITYRHKISKETPFQTSDSKQGKGLEPTSKIANQKTGRS